MKRFFITVQQEGFTPTIMRWFYAETEQDAINQVLEKMFVGASVTGLRPHLNYFINSTIEIVMEQHESKGWANEYEPIW